MCAVPDARYACQENEKERRNACLQSLCVAVTCPPDPRELPLGDDITTATRVCDVCEMYGYTRGGEVQAQGLRFGPKAMLAAYSAFLFVDFAMGMRLLLIVIIAIILIVIIAILINSNNNNYYSINSNNS